MEKGKLIESIRQELLRQSPNQDSNKFAHFLTIEVEIGKAYTSALKEFYLNDKNLENAELDYYAKSYTLPVVRTTDRNYVTLTATPVELKKNLGIRSVKPKSSITGVTGDFSFLRTTETELEIIRNLEVWCCTKKAFYYKDGNNIVLAYPNVEYNLIENVVVKMLPSFADFDMTDNIEFPMGELNATSALLTIMGLRPVNNLNADDIR
jgi:hypothetical protein